MSPLRSMISPCYLEGDKTLWTAGDSSRRLFNVESVQKLFSDIYSYLEAWDIMYVGTLQNTEKGEELIVGDASLDHFESVSLVEAVQDLK